MRVLLIGHGGWGRRVADAVRDTEGLLLSGVYDERVDQLPDDPELRVRSLDGYLDVMRPEAAIIATPPSPHGSRLELVHKLLEYGVQHIRIEKPLALSVEEGEQIVDACYAEGAYVSVGFTLLHHPLYDAAFAYLRARGSRVVRGEAIRIGRRPVHRVDPMCDLGSHAAAVFAYLGIDHQKSSLFPPVLLHAAYSEDAQIRITRIFTTSGVVKIDEVSGVVDTPDGVLTIRPGGDALRREMDAWLHGYHRGTTTVALRALRMVEDELAQVAS